MMKKLSGSFDFSSLRNVNIKKVNIGVSFVSMYYVVFIVIQLFLFISYV